MRIGTNDTDEVVLRELGQRLASRRIELELTQAELAEKAGVGKRTLERIESGGSSQMTNLIRVLRTLGLLEVLDRLLPEPGPRPMELLRTKAAARKRASPKRRRAAKGAEGGNEPWTWGDES